MVHPPPAQPVAHQVAMVLGAAPVAAVALALRAPAAVILLPVVKADDVLVGWELSPCLGKACLCETNALFCYKVPSWHAQDFGRSWN